MKKPYITISMLQFLVRKFWAVAAVLLILLALIVQLGRSLSPEVADYQQVLSEYLSEQLSMQVHLDGLSAQWQGLEPTLRLESLKLHSLSGAQALSVSQVHAKLDLLRSLFALHPVWRSLTFEELQTKFLQSEDGRWSIVGMPISSVKDEDGEELVINDPIDIFLLGKHIELSRSQLEFLFFSGHTATVDVPSILLENYDDFHRLSLNMDIDERQDAVQMIFEGQGDPRNRDTFKAQGYLRVQQLSTEKPLAALASHLWKGLPNHKWRRGGHLDIEAWVESKEGGGFDLRGKVDLQGWPLPLAKDVAPIHNFNADVSGHWRAGADWKVALSNTELVWGSQVTPSLTLAVGAAAFDAPLKLEVEKVELSRWLALLRDNSLLSGKLADVIDVLQPKGQLRNVQISIPPLQPLDFQVQANLEQVAVNAWKGAPGVTKVDGYIELNRLDGFVELDSQNGFSMFYDGVYAEPMAYHSARGQVAWSVQPENNAIYVNSGHLSFKGDDGDASGLLYLYLPWEKGSALTDMYLQIGLRNSQAKFHKKYVPQTVSQSLRDWLGRSLSDGQVIDGGFIYRGSLLRGENEHRSTQLYLNVDNAALDYHPQWPALSELQGLIFVDDADVDGRVQSGRLYGSDLAVTQVDVDPNPQGEGLLLKIVGGLQGDAADGLRVLRESRLRNAIGDNMDSWNLQGNMQTTLNLSVPLSEGEAGASQQVDISLADSYLAMDNLNLNFEQIQGDISYSDSDGLRAPLLKADLWKKPVSIILETSVDKETLVIMDAEHPVRSLAEWSRRPELLFLQGDLHYLAKLTIPTASQQKDYVALLDVDSDMKGVELKLPAPFAKTSEQLRPLQVQVPVGKEKTLYDIRYGDLLHGLFEQQGKTLQQGVVALLEKASLDNAALNKTSGEMLADIEGPQIVVKGRLEHFDLAQWRPVFSQYENYVKEIAALPTLSAADENTEPKPEREAELDAEAEPYTQLTLDVAIDEFIVDKVQLDKLSVQGEKQTGRWKFAAKNNLLAGTVFVADDGQTPLVLDLDYLHLPASNDETAGLDSERHREGGSEGDREKGNGNNSADPLADINPADLISMDFSTDEFTIGDDHYGQWSFQLRQIENGVQANNLKALVRGATIGGDEQAKPATLTWTSVGGEMATRFKGRVTAKDLADVMTQWQKPKLVDSKSAELVADFSWLGSPANISLYSLEGDVAATINKGRFKKNVGGTEDAFLRLVGLFNFDSWARRLKLDFSDLYKGGMAYDKIEGRLRFDRGTLYITDPVKVKTPSSRLQMAGIIDIKNEQLDTTLVATLPVAGNATLIAAMAAGLPVAVGVYVISKLLEKQVDKIASVSYSIKGDWQDPEVEFGKIFDSKAAKRTGEKTQEAVEKEAVKKESDTQ